MLGFLFNPGAELLIPKTNSYWDVLRDRIKSKGIKYKEVLSLSDELEKVMQNGGKNSFGLFQKTFHLCLECSGYAFYFEIRNMYDYEFHLKDLALVNNSQNRTLSKEQASIFLSVFNGLVPFMEEHFKEATKSEAKRKQIIEAAGMRYERHIYPDYRGCDELFYDYPIGPEDSVLENAKQILNQKGISVV